MGFLNQISRHQAARLKRTHGINPVEWAVAMVESSRQSVLVIGTFFLMAMEVAALVIYIYIDFKFVLNQTEFDFDTYPIPMPFFYTQTAFCFFFLAVWGLMMCSHGTSFKEKMLTFRTLTTFLTAIPQLFVFVYQFFDSAASNGFIPMFMRIWWLHYYTIFLISMPYLPVPELARDTISVLSPLVAVMVTSAGLYSVTVRFSKDENISAFDAFYYSFVTFGTIGFGDLSPSTDYGRAVVICMIVAAIYIFPQLFAKLTDIISRRKLFFRMAPRKDGRHVIVVGTFSLKDVKWILQEFFTDDRIFMKTRVVFLSPEVYAPEIYLFASSPKYVDCAKLIIGSPQKAEDLDRCCGRTADAIFLMSNPEENAVNSDYENVVTSLTLHHYDPDLPIHVILKRATTRQFVSKVASVVMVSEIIKINLIGLGAILPGALPLIVNLVRNYDNPDFTQHRVVDHLVGVGKDDEDSCSCSSSSSITSSGSCTSSSSSSSGRGGGIGKSRPSPANKRAKRRGVAPCGCELDECCDECCTDDEHMQQSANPNSSSEPLMGRQRTLPGASSPIAGSHNGSSKKSLVTPLSSSATKKKTEYSHFAYGHSDPFAIGSPDHDAEHGIDGNDRDDSDTDADDRRRHHSSSNDDDEDEHIIHEETIHASTFGGSDGSPRGLPQSSSRQGGGGESVVTINTLRSDGTTSTVAGGGGSDSVATPTTTTNTNTGTHNGASFHSSGGVGSAVSPILARQQQQQRKGGRSPVTFGVTPDSIVGGGGSSYYTETSSAFGTSAMGGTSLEDNTTDGGDGILGSRRRATTATDVTDGSDVPAGGGGSLRTGSSKRRHRYTNASSSSKGGSLRSDHHTHHHHHRHHRKGDDARRGRVSPLTPRLGGAAIDGGKEKEGGSRHHPPSSPQRDQQKSAPPPPPPPHSPLHLMKDEAVRSGRRGGGDGEAMGGDDNPLRPVQSSSPDDDGQVTNEHGSPAAAGGGGGDMERSRRSRRRSDASRHTDRYYEGVVRRSKSSNLRMVSATGLQEAIRRSRQLSPMDEYQPNDRRVRSAAPSASSSSSTDDGEERRRRRKEKRRKKRDSSSSAIKKSRSGAGDGSPSRPIPVGTQRLLEASVMTLDSDGTPMGSPYSVTNGRHSATAASSKKSSHARKRRDSDDDRKGTGPSHSPSAGPPPNLSMTSATAAAAAAVAPPALTFSDEAPWQILNAWSIGNELYTIPVPIELVESDFTALNLAMAAYTVTVIGIVNAYGDVMLNPAGMLVREEDALICIAQDITHIADGLQTLYNKILKVPERPEYVSPAARKQQAGGGGGGGTAFTNIGGGDDYDDTHPPPNAVDTARDNSNASASPLRSGGGGGVDISSGDFGVGGGQSGDFELPPAPTKARSALHRLRNFFNPSASQQHISGGGEAGDQDANNAASSRARDDNQFHPLTYRNKKSGLGEHFPRHSNPRHFRSRSHSSILPHRHVRGQTYSPGQKAGPFSSDDNGIADGGSNEPQSALRDRLSGGFEEEVAVDDGIVACVRRRNGGSRLVMRKGGGLSGNNSSNNNSSTNRRGGGPKQSATYSHFAPLYPDDNQDDDDDANDGNENGNGDGGRNDSFFDTFKAPSGDAPLIDIIGGARKQTTSSSNSGNRAGMNVTPPPHQPRRRHSAMRPSKSAANVAASPTHPTAAAHFDAEVPRKAKSSVDFGGGGGGGRHRHRTDPTESSGPEDAMSKTIHQRFRKRQQDAFRKRSGLIFPSSAHHLGLGGDGRNSPRAASHQPTMAASMGAINSGGGGGRLVGGPSPVSFAHSVGGPLLGASTVTPNTSRAPNQWPTVSNASGSPLGGLGGGGPPPAVPAAGPSPQFLNLSPEALGANSARRRTTPSPARSGGPSASGGAVATAAAAEADPDPKKVTDMNSPFHEDFVVSTTSRPRGAVAVSPSGYGCGPNGSPLRRLGIGGGGGSGGMGASMLMGGSGRAATPHSSSLNQGLLMNSLAATGTPSLGASSARHPSSYLTPNMGASFQHSPFGGGGARTNLGSMMHGMGATVGPSALRQLGASSPARPGLKTSLGESLVVGGGQQQQGSNSQSNVPCMSRTMGPSVGGAMGLPTPAAGIHPMAMSVLPPNHPLCLQQQQQQYWQQQQQQQRLGVAPHHHNYFDVNASNMGLGMGLGGSPHRQQQPHYSAPSITPSHHHHNHNHNHHLAQSTILGVAPPSAATTALSGTTASAAMGPLGASLPIVTAATSSSSSNALLVPSQSSHATAYSGGNGNGNPLNLSMLAMNPQAVAAFNSNNSNNTVGPAPTTALGGGGGVHGYGSADALDSDLAYSMRRNPVHCNNNPYLMMNNPYATPYNLNAAMMAANSTAMHPPLLQQLQQQPGVTPTPAAATGYNAAALIFLQQQQQMQMQRQLQQQLQLAQQQHASGTSVPAAEGITASELLGYYNNSNITPPSTAATGAPIPPAGRILPRKRKGSAPAAAATGGDADDDDDDAEVPPAKTATVVGHTANTNTNTNNANMKDTITVTANASSLTDAGAHYPYGVDDDSGRSPTAAVSTSGLGAGTTKSSDIGALTRTKSSVLLPPTHAAEDEGAGGGGEPSAHTPSPTLSLGGASPLGGAAGVGGSTSAVGGDSSSQSGLFNMTAKEVLLKEQAELTAEEELAAGGGGGAAAAAPPAMPTTAATNNNSLVAPPPFLTNASFGGGVAMAAPAMTPQSAAIADIVSPQPNPLLSPEQQQYYQDSTVPTNDFGVFRRETAVWAYRPQRRAGRRGPAGMAAAMAAQQQVGAGMVPITGGVVVDGAVRTTPDGATPNGNGGGGGGGVMSPQLINTSFASAGGGGRPPIVSNTSFGVGSEQMSPSMIPRPPAAAANIAWTQNIFGTSSFRFKSKKDRNGGEVEREKTGGGASSAADDRSALPTPKTGGGGGDGGGSAAASRRSSMRTMSSQNAPPPPLPSLPSPPPPPASSSGGSVAGASTTSGGALVATSASRYVDAVGGQQGVTDRIVTATSAAHRSRHGNNNTNGAGRQSSGSAGGGALSSRHSGTTGSNTSPSPPTPAPSPPGIEVGSICSVAIPYATSTGTSAATSAVHSPTTAMTANPSFSQIPASVINASFATAAPQPSLPGNASLAPNTARPSSSSLGGEAQVGDTDYAPTTLPNASMVSEAAAAAAEVAVAAMGSDGGEASFMDSSPSTTTTLAGSGATVAEMGSRGDGAGNPLSITASDDALLGSGDVGSPNRVPPMLEIVPPTKRGSTSSSARSSRRSSSSGRGGADADHHLSVPHHSSSSRLMSPLAKDEEGRVFDNRSLGAVKAPAAGTSTAYTVGNTTVNVVVPRHHGPHLGAESAGLVSAGAGPHHKAMLAAAAHHSAGGEGMRMRTSQGIAFGAAVGSPPPEAVLQAMKAADGSFGNAPATAHKTFSEQLNDITMRSAATGMNPTAYKQGAAIGSGVGGSGGGGAGMAAVMVTGGVNSGNSGSLPTALGSAGSIVGPDGAYCPQNQQQQSNALVGGGASSGGLPPNNNSSLVVVPGAALAGGSVPLPTLLGPLASAPPADPNSNVTVLHADGPVPAAHRSIAAANGADGGSGVSGSGGSGALTSASGLVFQGTTSMILPPNPVSYQQQHLRQEQAQLQAQLQQQRLIQLQQAEAEAQQQLYFPPTMDILTGGYYGADGNYYFYDYNGMGGGVPPPLPFGFDAEDFEEPFVTFIYLERLRDMRALNDHIVIVDLFSAFYDVVPSSDAAGAESRAIDLFTVLHPIKSRDAHTPIVLLSMMEPNAYFEELWKEHNYEPILFITGCGMNVNDLAKCHLEKARSVVIFASGETASDRSDEISLMVALSVRQAVGERNVPILTEIDNTESLYSFPPHYSNEVCFDTATTIATGEDPRARELFSFAASVLTGSVVSTKMLDAAIFHNYFNPYMLKVVEALVGGSVTHYTNNHGRTDDAAFDPATSTRRSDSTLRRNTSGGHTAAGSNDDGGGGNGGDPYNSSGDTNESTYQAVVGLSSMPNSKEDPFGETYLDAVRKFAAEGVVVLGLYRIIRDDRHGDLDGRRFMLTNPPPFTTLLHDDIVYYISK